MTGDPSKGAPEGDVVDDARLLKLVEQVAQVGHWRVDLVNERISWSPEVFRIHGLNPRDGEPTLARAVAAYHPDDREKVDRFIAEAVERRTSFEFTLRLMRPSGEMRHVVSRGFCELDATGGVPALFGVILDVTDLKRAEAAVHESEARHRMLSEAATDMIIRADLDTTRRYVSPASRELLGYTPEELVGTKPLDQVHPDDVERYGATLASLVAGEVETASSQQRYLRRDGAYVWVEASFRLIRDGQGRPSGYVAAVRDIDERVAAQKAVEESEARFRLLAENTSEMIMLGHDDGRRSYISPASLRLLGYTPEELEAMRLRDYVHPDDLERLYETTRRLIAGEQEASIVYRALHKERGWTWVEGGFRRIPNARGDAPTIVATFRDVTERLRQAEALRHAKETAEFARAQAEAASRAKSDFLASMSHEIRTPLNGILGYTDLLLEEEALDASHVRLVERIQSAGAALLTVVNDILDFSEIENGKIELEPRPFALEQLVDNTVSIVRGLAARKRLDVRVVIDKRAPRMVVGDSDRLRQVLLNLLNNAVKFTPSGSVTLSVKHVATGPDGARLRFAVADTGIGIPEDKRSRLFERFSQLDGSIRREFGGTGLGLAISKSLVELMGGTIGVDSELGHGAQFWLQIVLPVADEAGAERVEAPAAIVAGPKAKVLLVEDLEINQELALAVLRSIGHDVDVVADGAEAVMAVKTTRYDVVLMDVHMPGMDGVTATQHIRSLDSSAAGVPIVAMTANVLPDQVAKFKAAGMNDHVGKPFRRADLAAAIERWTRAPAMEAPSDDGALERGQYDQVQELLGPEATVRMMGRLADEIVERLSDSRLGADDRNRIAHDAHAIVSAAGLLGFMKLSGACSALEEACRRGWATGEPLKRVSVERDAALSQITRITQAAAKGAAA